MYHQLHDESLDLWAKQIAQDGNNAYSEYTHLEEDAITIQRMNNVDHLSDSLCEKAVDQIKDRQMALVKAITNRLIQLPPTDGSFGVRLTGCGDKIGTIKVIRQLCGTMGLKEAKDASENLPYTFLGYSERYARILINAFEQVGSKAEIVPSVSNEGNQP